MPRTPTPRVLDSEVSSATFVGYRARIFSGLVALSLACTHASVPGDGPPPVPPESVPEPPRWQAPVDPCLADPGDLDGELCRSEEAASAGDADRAARIFTGLIDDAVLLDPSDPRVAQTADLARAIVAAFDAERRVPAAVSFLDDARRQAEGAGGRKQVLVAHLLFALAGQLNLIANRVGAELAARESAALAGELLGDSSSIAIQASILRGHLLLGAGRLDEAAAVAEQAVAASRDALASGRLDLLDAGLLQAKVRHAQGNAEEAIAIVGEVDEVCLAAYGAEFFGRSMTLSMKAELLYFANRTDESIEAGQSAAALYAANGRAPDRNLMVIYGRLAEAARVLGRMEQAYTWAEASLEALQAQPAVATDDLMGRFELLATMAAESGRSYEAEAYLLRAMSIAQRLKILTDSRIAVYYALGAEIAAQQHRDDQAEDTFRRAVALARTSGRPDPRAARDVGVRFAAFRIARGRLQEAETLIEEAVQLDEVPNRMRGPTYLRGLYLRALVQHGLGRLGPARDHYRVAIRVGEESLGRDSLHLIPLYEGYARLLAETQRTAESKRYAARASALHATALGGLAATRQRAERHEFPDLGFSYQLPPPWEAFDPEARRAGGVVGFAHPNYGVMTTVTALRGSGHLKTTADAMTAVREAMRIGLGEFRLEEERDRTVAGIPGQEIGISGILGGKAYRYRIWIAMRGPYSYELKMWSMRDQPPFPEAWAEFLEGFRPLPPLSHRDDSRGPRESGHPPATEFSSVSVSPSESGASSPPRSLAYSSLQKHRTCRRSAPPSS